MQKIYDKWWPLFSMAVLMLLPIGNNYGCYWYPETEEYRFSAFMPLAIPTNTYRPFFFTTQFMNAYNKETELKPDRALNVKEWQAYLGNKVDSANIDYLLYTVEPASFQEISSGSSYSDYQHVKQNSFFSLMQGQQYKALRQYMGIAKGCEAIVNRQVDTWDEEWDTVDDSLAIHLLDSTLVYMRASTDKYLRLRYAFQYLRLAAYVRSHNTIEEVYKKEVATYSGNTIIKPWGEYYYMLELFRQGRDAEASYHAARVFKACTEKRRSTYMFFKHNSVEQALRYAQNNDERADIIGLDALQNTSKKLNAIKRIMALNPKHGMIELLVMRELNKLESAVLTPQVNDIQIGNYYYEDIKSKESDQGVYFKQYGKQLLSYFEACSADNPIGNKAFWYVAAAHTAFVLGNDSLALQHLRLGESYISQANTGIQMQAKLTGLMAEARMAKQIDAAFEERIYKEAMWLQTHTEYADAQEMLKQFMAFLSTNYKHQGNLGKATLCRRASAKYYDSPTSVFNGKYYNDMYSIADEFDSVAYNDFTYTYLYDHATPQQAQDMISLLTSKHKTPYETWLCSNLQHDKDFMNNLYAIVGSLYLQADELAQTMHHFKQVPTWWWTEKDGWYTNQRHDYLDANPFYAKFKYNHKPTKADTVKYTRIEFVEKLVALKHKQQTAPDEATYLAIADAYYNITNYGNAWQMVRTSYSSNHYIRYPHFDDDYYGCSTAIKYYTQAYNYCTSKENKARAYAMLALCQRHRAVYMHNTRMNTDWNNFAKGFNLNNNQHLRTLLSLYGNTEYVQGLIAECQGRKAFVKNFEYGFGGYNY